MTFGKINIIMGCMFSGKSTEIIRIVNKYKILQKKILLINHSIDNRYSDNKISTHNKIMIDCLSTDNLINIPEQKCYKESDIVIVEEAQFFKDLFKFIVDGAEKDKKTMIVVGLNGDSDRKPFGDVLRLIPYCDTVTKLDAFCVKCGDGTLAHFSKKVDTCIDTQVHVGSEESYIAVCRKHYLE